MAADISERLDAGSGDACARVLDEVADQAVEHALERFVELQLVGRGRVLLLYFAIEAPEDADAFADLTELQDARLQAVVEVGGVVGDLVGQVDELGLERRTLEAQLID